MISNILSGDPFRIIGVLLSVPALLIAITVHEYSHGRMALALGDKTALISGRLSLNPLKHLDIIGALMLLFFGFGFAKPVPINLRNVTKTNYKTGIILISLAGPFSNFILAFAGTFVQHVFYSLLPFISVNSAFAGNLILISDIFIDYFIMLNIGLGLFNLIPLPPLDGSRVLTIFLPAKAQIFFYKYERYIQLGLFVLLAVGVLNGPLVFARNAIYNLFFKILGLLPF